MPASSSCRVVTTATAGPPIGCPSPGAAPERRPWTYPGAEWLLGCPTGRWAEPCYPTGVTGRPGGGRGSAGGCCACPAAAATRGPPAPRVRSALRPVAQAPPQLQHRLGVDLTDAAFGHAQDLADLR